MSARSAHYYDFLTECNDKNQIITFFSDRWVTKHGQEKILPGMNLNQKQLFWLSAANVWCQKYRPKALESLIKLDTHVPGKFRVLGAYSNIPDFARDFKCPVGSTYNPVHKCKVW